VLVDCTAGVRRQESLPVEGELLVIDTILRSQDLCAAGNDGDAQCERVRSILRDSSQVKGAHDRESRALGHDAAGGEDGSQNAGGSCGRETHFGELDCGLGCIELMRCLMKLSCVSTLEVLSFGINSCRIP
jgi:hypothetical protein